MSQASPAPVYVYTMRKESIVHRGKNVRGGTLVAFCVAAIPMDAVGQNGRWRCSIVNASHNETLCVSCVGSCSWTWSCVCMFFVLREAAPN